MHELDNLPGGFVDGIWAKLAHQSELAEMPAELKRKYIDIMFTEIDRHAQRKYELRKIREEGLKQGIEQGLEQGKIEIARNMKASGIEADVISQCTGLTIEQIAEL